MDIPHLFAVVGRLVGRSVVGYVDVYGVWLTALYVHFAAFRPKVV